MIINHNLASLNTLNVLGRNEKATQSSLAKLSSGLRINSAADDAAGLAISEKMRGQIRGLDQAKTNSQNAISLTQTAEGNLNETSSILQRMRELAVQSANDTATDANRKEIQKEIVQLKTEIDRISNTAQFNTKKLLNGDVGNTANVIGANTLAFKPLQVSDSDLAADTYTVKATNAATIGVTTGVNTTGIKSDGTEFKMTATDVAGLKLGNYTLNVKSAAGGKFDFALKDKNGNVVASVNGKDNSADVVLTGSAGQKFTIASGAAYQAGEMKINLNATYATASDFSITNSQGTSTFSSAAGLKITDSDFVAGGIQFEMTVDTALKTDTTGTAIKTTNNALTMQIGANANQTMQVAINKIDTKTLGIDGLDLSTKDGAQTAITAIDGATDKVSSERAKLGAIENRLQHTIANLTASSENLATAESRIRHVDMAAEMAKYQRNLVLQQAAQAMLAQANQQPQQVLKLLS